MATDLEGNKKLQRFIELLADLNRQTVQVLKTGDAELLIEMNGTVEEMYSIQHGSKEEAFTAIDEDMQIIYQNFNAVVVMIKTNEKAFVDKTTSEAVRKFLHNIFDANVRIVIAYGLA
ncbi:MAG: hypothetical protein IJB34_07295 [Clostridia bacterium]|nr:hypothetical protein [Clostridia bacterium]